MSKNAKNAGRRGEGTLAVLIVLAILGFLVSLYLNHVHYKDWDGDPEFALMGAGQVDFVGITRWLAGWGYDGWIILEDEAEQAVDDPDGVTLHDGAWVRDTLIPAVTSSAEEA